MPPPSTTNYELKDIQAAKVQQPQLPDVVVLDGRNGPGKASRPVANQQQQLPFDKYQMVYLILLIHGIGSLMPWNMFINANDYFKSYKLAGEPSLQKNFLNYLGPAAQVPNLIFNGLNLLVPNIGSGNLRLRVNLMLLIEAIIFFTTIVLACVDSSQWQVTFFYATMLSVVVLNMASGIYQNCVFGTGAKFPSRYTNAILIGSNLSGTFTSTVNLLSIWLAPEPQTAAIYYFVTALFVIVICLVTYNLLSRNIYFRYYDELCCQKEQADESALVNTTVTSEQSSHELIHQDGAKAQNDDEIPEILRETVDAMVPRPEEPEKATFKSELQAKWQVFLKCWPQCFNVFFTFYITLALFPAILANVSKSQESIFKDAYFNSFACFFIFNVFAMIGNLISSWTTWPGKDHVWILVLLRILFIPFFLLCNFNPRSRTWIVLFGDFSFISGNVLLAASSGYLSSLCMMFASAGLQGQEASKAGMLAAFFLILGIFAGVNSSFLLTWLVEL